MGQETDRTEGVEVGDLEPIYEEVTFPVTAADVVDRFGDRELDRTNAEPITIRELFESMGETEFHSREDLETMILGQMPRDSEGRTNYSDRGGSHPVETDEAEEASEQTSADIEDGTATDRDDEQSS